MASHKHYIYTNLLHMHNINVYTYIFSYLVGLVTLILTLDYIYLPTLCVTAHIHRLVWAFIARILYEISTTISRTVSICNFQNKDLHWCWSNVIADLSKIWNIVFFGFLRNNKSICLSSFLQPKILKVLLILTMKRLYMICKWTLLYFLLHTYQMI